MESKENMVRRAAEIIQAPLEVCEKTIHYVEEVDAYYISNPIRGGAAVLMKSENDFLYATSAVTFAMHKKAFQDGMRSDVASFNENPNGKR